MAFVCPVLDNQYFDPNGNPLAGGKLFFYQGGSFSIAKTTYANAAGTIVNPNPIVLDSSGYLIPDVFLDPGPYNIALTMPDGTTVLNTWVNIEGIDCDCSRLYIGNHWPILGRSTAYYDCAIDSVGNIYSVGSFGVTGGPIDLYTIVTKTDNSGTILWTRYASVNHKLGAALARCVVDSEDNLYVAGIRSDGDDIFPPQNYDMLLMKYTSTGTLAWQRVITTGTPGQEEIFELPFGLTVDADDNVYIGFGAFYGYPSILKYNRLGALEWNKQVTYSSNLWIRNLSYDESTDEICYSGGGAPGGLGRIAASDGAHIWSTGIAVVQDAFLCGTVCQDGNTWVIMSTPGPEIYTLTVFKIDDTQNIVWQRQYDLPPAGIVTNYTWGFRLHEGNLYICSNTLVNSFNQIELLEIDSGTGICNWAQSISYDQLAVWSYGMDVRDGRMALAGAMTQINPSAIGIVARLPLDSDWVGEYGYWTYADRAVTEVTPTYTLQAQSHNTIPGTLIDQAGNLTAYTHRTTAGLFDLRLA